MVPRAVESTSPRIDGQLHNALGTLEEIPLSGKSIRCWNRRHGYQLRVEELEPRVQPSTNVLTYHNDVARTGQNLTETPNARVSNDNILVLLLGARNVRFPC